MKNIKNSTQVIREHLLTALAKDAYRYGDFILSSGRKSSHYVNCKPVSLSGSGLYLISKLILPQIEKDSIAVAGLTLGADPLVSGVALLASQEGRSLDGLIVRKEAKGHGTGEWLEGPLPARGSVVTVLEDVVTSGASSLKAVHQLREEGYLVRRVISIVDREEGAELKISNEGLELISLFLLKDIAAKSKKILS